MIFIRLTPESKMIVRSSSSKLQQARAQEQKPATLKETKEQTTRKT